MWLYVPSVCVPDTGVSRLASAPQECPPAPPVSWKGKAMPQPTWLRLWRRERWPRLLSGATSPPSTASLGVKRWIASLQASRASHSPPPREGDGSRQTSGPTSPASSQSAELQSCSSKTSAASRWSGRAGSLLPWDTTPLSADLAPPPWVPRTDETGGGYLPTITVRVNYSSPSMMKWPAYRRLRLLTGGVRPGPTWWEWMMGVPMGRTAYASSATASSPHKQLSRSKNCTRD